MKQHPRNASRTVTKHPACLAQVSLLVQVLVFFLVFAVPAMAAENLPDQSGTTAEVSAEQVTDSEAQPETASDSLDAERIACFDRLWSSYQEDVWFYDQNGQRVVPQPALDWLVVRLMDATRQIDTLPEDTTDSYSAEISDNLQMGDSNAQPPSFESFNQQYGEYFSHFLHDPELGPAMAAYRLRRDMPKEVFQTLMTRLQQDPQVKYAHPAWRIADQLYAPLERIAIRWKTAASPQQRQALLQAIEAVETDEITPSNRQSITIDPCRQSVWQTANLLAEDISVAQAWPVLMPLIPPVGVQFSLAMNGAMPGTPIPFTFEIRFTDKVKIESSTIANLNLKPGGIFHNLYDISYDVPLSAVDLNRSPIRITGQIKIYATGEYNLPGIPVYYTDSGAPRTKVQLIKTTEVPVRIAAMIPESQQGFDLQVAEPAPLPGMDDAAATGAKRHHAMLMLAGLVLIGLVCASAAILRRSRQKMAVQPENHALNRLYQAVSAVVLATEQHLGLKELAVLGVALKNYLAEFAGLDEDMRGGSHTAFFHRIEDALPRACRPSAADVLSIIDHALARGDQAVIPADLPEKAGKLIAEVRACSETLQDVPEKH
ncbi:MAG: hypothetical protein AB7D06_03315 [Pedobacter sp.]